MEDNTENCNNESPNDEDAAAYSLTTIEEQPELGYQSDSSETEFLLPRNRDSSDLGTALPTLHEHPDEKEHQC